MEKISTLLLKLDVPAERDSGLGKGLAALIARSGLAAAGCRAHATLSGNAIYVYLDLGGAPSLGAADMQHIERAADGISELAATGLSASRLALAYETEGASSGEAAPFHYCVEFDPAPGWEPEIASWYDTEHMPGLAKAHGCVRAWRFLNLDAGPRSLACYDLVSPAARETKTWQDVVATPWASRVRPHFHNTKRTLFARMSAT
jgi:hypothetical protein